MKISLAALALSFSLLLLACSQTTSEVEGADAEKVYVTSTILFNAEGETTLVSFLPDLGKRKIDLKKGIEFPGWSGIFVNDDRLFISSGEAPIMTNFTVSSDGTIEEDGKISFANEGAMDAGSTFIADEKAYVFADRAVVWNPKTMEITGTFELPDLDDQEGGLLYGGVRGGRALAVREKRAYAATHWANWDEYSVAEDSVVVVIDTENDKVLKTISVPCPYLDVATTTDDGYVYLSNWGYSLGGTLLNGKRKACAVRIAPGKDEIDEEWTLTFADVTGGHEAGALRALGPGKALISVFHEERIDLEDFGPETIADSANWQFAILDLESKEVTPIEDIDFHAGGYSLQRVDGKSFLMVPSGDYESTSIFDFSDTGKKTLLWETTGWSTQLARLR